MKDGGRGGDGARGGPGVAMDILELEGLSGGRASRRGMRFA